MESYISVRHVSKTFGRKTVLKDVSLSVAQGQTAGIIGANGSGKSVLFKIICGFLKPDQGEVYVRGQELGKERDFPENLGVFINSPGFVSIYSGIQRISEFEISCCDSGKDRR